MKRFFALLLIAFLLCGCSKSYAEILNPGGTSMYDKDATQPTTAPLLPQENYPEGTALVVKFEMGAEFVVLLDSWHAVIDVTAENEAGEALLAGIEPAGSYRNAVETILSEANDQTLLESGTVITLTANEVIAGTWTVAGHNILTWPLENYAKAIGTTITCQLNAPGPYYDDSTYTDTFTRDDGDRITTVCYRAVQEMDYCFYDNGDYEEYYYVTHDESLGCTYYADGRFHLNYSTPLYCNDYTLEPDGFHWGYTETRDDAGNLLQCTSVNEDGTYFDDYYENGIVVRSISGDSSGSRCEYTYYENGEIKYSIYEEPNGYLQEDEYYENGVIKKSFSRNEDGYTAEYEYYENGALKREFVRYADGTEYEGYYDEYGNPISAPTE